MTKTKKRAPLAEVVSFAHLLPLTVGASARAEDDDEKDKGPDAENDEDGEDGDDKKPAGRKAKKARADDQGNDDGEDDGTEDDDDPDANDDDGEDEDDKKPSGKKAKKAKSKADDGGDDDDDGDDDEDDASARAGAMRERARCAAIFGSRHAAGRPDLAAHLAFSTNMSAREAIGTMKTLVGGQKTGARSSLAARMEAESVPNPGQGSGETPTGARGLAAAMLQASKKAHGG